MFIIPFIHKITQETNFLVHSIKILTVGGKLLWEEDDNLDIEKDILAINDIYAKTRPIIFNKNCQLCEVNIDKTNVNDFYTWNEISENDNETFCWRTFIYISGLKDETWLNIPNNEVLGNYNLDKIISSIVKINLEFSLNNN